MNSEYHKAYDESPTTDYPAIAAVSTYRFRCKSIIESVFAFHFSITENWFTTEPRVRNSFCFCAYQDTNNKPARHGKNSKALLCLPTVRANYELNLSLLMRCVTWGDLHHEGTGWRIFFFQFFFWGGGGKGVSHRQQSTQCIKGNKELLVCKCRFSFTYVL